MQRKFIHHVSRNQTDFHNSGVRTRRLLSQGSRGLPPATAPRVLRLLRTLGHHPPTSLSTVECHPNKDPHQLDLCLTSSPQHSTVASQAATEDPLNSPLPGMEVNKWDTLALPARVVTAVHSRRRPLSGASPLLKGSGKPALVATKASSVLNLLGR